MSPFPELLRFRDTASLPPAAKDIRARFQKANGSRFRTVAVFLFRARPARASHPPPENPWRRRAVRQIAGDNSSAGSALRCGPRETAIRECSLAFHLRPDTVGG